MKKLSLLFLLPLFFISCSEEPTGPDGGNADKIFDASMQDYPQYLKGSSTEITTGQTTYYFTGRLIFQIGNLDYFDYNAMKYESALIYNIYAQFDNYYHRFSEVKINDSNLTARSDGIVFQGGGQIDLNNEKGIKLNLGNTPNHIFIKGNDYISEIDTNIFFLPKFDLINIKSGDTINGSKSFSAKWNGITDDFARFSIYELNAVNDSAFFVEGIIKNDGEFIFTPKILENAKSGKYLISIERIEPHTIELKDQLPFSILVRHTRQKQIYLKK